MRKEIRLLLFCLLNLSVFLILSCSGEKEPATQRQLNVNTSPGVGENTSKAKTPELFALLDLQGKTRVFSDFVGKPFILNFWATWCPPCRREIPYFKRIYDEYQPQGLQIVGISLDADPSKVAPFVKQYNMKWVILHGDRNVANRLNIGTGIPVTIFYYADGAEAGRIIGAQPEAQFRQYVNEVMSKFTNK
jgi:thiol-disulfide isomerase/thioredoxin